MNIRNPNPHSKFYRNRFLAITLLLALLALGPLIFLARLGENISLSFSPLNPTPAQIQQQHDIQTALFAERDSRGFVLVLFLEIPAVVFAAIGAAVIEVFAGDRERFIARQEKISGSSYNWEFRVWRALLMTVVFSGLISAWFLANEAKYKEYGEEGRLQEARDAQTSIILASFLGTSLALAAETVLSLKLTSRPSPP